MKTLYLDCTMGAAGDMLTAALLELLPDPGAFLAELNGLGIPGVVFTAEKREKCGITGTYVSVKICGREEDAPDHTHAGLGDIRALIQALPIPTVVKLDVLAVYEEIARAESRVHAVPVSRIHLHEVGALDAIADVTAVCLLLHRLSPEKIIASPVHVGSGQVRCAHGILPVPAPATAYLLRGIPICSGEITGELCTPTGAALLRHFVTEFGEMPVMRVNAIGYGMGKKDFPRANCLRAMLAETEEAGEAVCELRCNLDDMTGEELGFAMEVLMENGALDAFTTPVGMKKSRPGVLLTVLCRTDAREKMAGLIFRHTTTLGVRVLPCQRYTLERREEIVQTDCGQVRRKISQGFGIRREKWEYADLAALAREKNLSLRDLRERINGTTPQTEES